ncbi:Aldehyde dehydrogenase 22A1 [Hibiscus syriacus]|uniref:Aldehyde dehydrogenase 22A1 n=1 Tax=Hibiscus syriacus TaxID=106335 RepID=A0A6A2Y3T3_HIBSY|nr:Aldehyde dehydrogenase 22A1 [Hibiscus syriacus]
MEEHKWRYLYSLLNRKPRLEATLDKCVKTLRELEHKARLCYECHEKIDVSSDRFVETMLADAGFLIELFLKYVVKGLKRRGDYVFNTSGLLYELRCDMLLLENQIPYFLLQRMFEIFPVPDHCKLSLTELAFRFFKDMIPGDHRLHLTKFGQEGNHLLDFIRHCFLPTVPRIKVKREEIRGLHYKASKLKAAGVKLKKASTEDLLDVKFVKGVLEIPPVEVHQYTETLLRNLIAFEQSGSGTTKHISSYVLFMKTLLEDEKDVKLVKRKQILTNYDVSENKQVETLFSRLWKEMKVMENVNDEFYYDGLCEQVKEYKRSSWQPQLKMSSPFRPGYLRQPLPLSPIMIVVAVLFVVLVIVGALFSIISFFRHKL